MKLVSLHSISAADIIQVTLFQVFSFKFENILVLKSIPKLCVASHTQSYQDLNKYICIFLCMHMCIDKWMHVSGCALFFRHLDSCKGHIVSVLLLFWVVHIKGKSQGLLSGLPEIMLRRPVHQSMCPCFSWHTGLKFGHSTSMKFKWC